MSWMYQLIRDEGKIRLCEMYERGEVGYVPVSWFKLFRYPIMTMRDLLSQRKHIGIIPNGEFLSEQITEMLEYNE